MKLLCIVLVFASMAFAEDSFESTGIRLALKIYEDCNNSEGFSPCLKKKAITFIDRLGKMDKLVLLDGVAMVRVPDASPEPSVPEEPIDVNLPRSSEETDAKLTNMLLDKTVKFIRSRSIEVTLPKIYPNDLSFEEGRGKKMKGMMGGMMMGIAAKMAALIPIAIAGLFLLAGKALIIAKIALLLSGIIAIKKLFASKQGGQSHGWSSGGGGGGWQSGGGGGGGWDKRSLDESHKLAYKAYVPK